MFRASRIPGVIGICASDTPSLLSYCNEAQSKLIKSGGDTGWWGSWVRMLFNVTSADPYITTPRAVARLINIDLCCTPIRIQNEFYEMLEFGIGLQTPNVPGSRTLLKCATNEAYDRGSFPTMVDIPAGNTIRAFLTDPADKNKRLFFSGTDANNNPIYTIDNGKQVNGFFLSLDTPFVDSVYSLNTITNILKDTTLGPVRIYGVAPVTGTQTLLASFSPGEHNPQFRRYFIGHLSSSALSRQVTGMAKLEFIPGTGDTDCLTIGNLDALKEECMAIRLSEMDNPTAKAEARDHHKKAIRYLNDEIEHYLGKELPALNFKPFGPRPICLSMR